jgi:hypothetical protein
MTGPGIDRRRFLRAGGLLGVGTVTATWGFGANSGSIPAAATTTADDAAGVAAARKLAAELLHDVKGARRIGSDYLVTFPDEASGLLLSASVAPDTASPDWWRRANRRTLSAVVRDRVRRDFMENEIWLWQGWALARTEGRLTALLVVD